MSAGMSSTRSGNRAALRGKPGMGQAWAEAERGDADTGSRRWQEALPRSASAHTLLGHGRKWQEMHRRDPGGAQGQRDGPQAAEQRAAPTLQPAQEINQVAPGIPGMQQIG